MRIITSTLSLSGSEDKHFDSKSHCYFTTKSLKVGASNKIAKLKTYR